MAEIGHLLVVDALQFFKAPPIRLQFGQGGVPQASCRDQAVQVAAVEIGVDADQFSQVLLLAAQLLLQGGQVEADQGLAPLDLFAHSHRQLQNLALGPGQKRNQPAVSAQAAPRATSTRCSGCRSGPSRRCSPGGGATGS
jgi:hypothetical protein